MTQVNAHGGLAGIGEISTAYARGIPMERILAAFYLMMAQRKGEVLQAETLELKDINDDAIQWARLQSLLGNAGNKMDMASTNTATAKGVTQAELDEINKLIKDLGVTDLFPGTVAYLPPAPQTDVARQELVVKDMYDEYKSWQSTFTGTGTYSDNDQEYGTWSSRPSWQTQFATQLQSVFGTTDPAKLPATLTATQLTTLNTKVRAAAGTTTNPLLTALKDYGTALYNRLEPLRVNGGMLGTTTGKQVSTALTLVGNYLNRNGTSHASQTNVTQEALAEQNNVFQALKSLNDQYGKGATEIMRGYS